MWLTADSAAELQGNETIGVRRFTNSSGEQPSCLREAKAAAPLVTSVGRPIATELRADFGSDDLPSGTDEPIVGVLWDVNCRHSTDTPPYGLVECR